MNKDSAISQLNGKALKLIDQLIYLGSNILSTVSDVNVQIDKVWTAIMLTTTWKSDLSN